MSAIITNAFGSRIYIEGLEDLSVFDLKRIYGLNQVADIYKIPVGNTVTLKFTCTKNTSLYLGRPDQWRQETFQIYQNQNGLNWGKWEANNLKDFFGPDDQINLFTFAIFRLNDYTYIVNIDVTPTSEIIQEEKMISIQEINTTDNSVVNIKLSETPDIDANASNFKVYNLKTGADIQISSISGSGVDYILTIPKQTQSFGVTYTV